MHYIWNPEHGFYQTHVTSPEGINTITWSYQLKDAEAFATAAQALDMIRGVNLQGLVQIVDAAKAATLPLPRRALPAHPPSPPMLPKRRIQEVKYLECATVIDLFADTVNEHLRDGWRLGPLVPRGGSAFVQALSREIDAPT